MGLSVEASTQTTTRARWWRKLEGLPFWGVHVACLLVLWVGWSWFAVAICAALYVIRVFAITGGYHRYFSHRTYKTSRPVQFLLALLGTSAVQKGPLWWAALHRHHHRYTDVEEDIHSPGVSGFWWSHVGWILSDKYMATRWDTIRDFAKFPELRLLNRYHILPPVGLAVGLFVAGYALEQHLPALQTSGSQLVIWGFFISTTLMYHATFTINSLAHVFGTRRFQTDDSSRNNLLLSLLTLGEGWHNNHHRYPASERQGFYWWEIDVTHYVLRTMSWFGLVWDLREPPPAIYSEAERSRPR
ncbi:MAG TPA: acyl-CoA desaturase [Candidatus Acidoferrales bacterium]|nr:acyl-CoA desaturase [Candidatus Acidoferrales bacterium]